jgi:hypothetical protein
VNFKLDENLPILPNVSGRERPAAEMCTPYESLKGGSLCGLVGLVLGHQARQLFTQQCRDRTVTAGCEDPRLANEILVERQGDVPLH